MHFSNFQSVADLIVIDQLMGSFFIKPLWLLFCYKYLLNVTSYSHYMWITMWIDSAQSGAAMNLSAFQAVG